MGVGGWGAIRIKKSLHKLRWEKVCWPVEFGGLGVRYLEVNNEALLAKMAWRISSNPDSDVTKLLQAKYYSGCDFWTCDAKKRCSASWRSILKGMDAIKECLRWNIEDGSNVDLWNDAWFYNLPLSSIVVENNVELPNLKVKDIIDTQNRCWNLNAIDNFIFTTGGRRY